jgi:fibronectin-binding autotransporter adhesin
MKPHTPTPQKTLMLPLAAGLLMLLISAGSVRAATYTWTGTTDGDWNDASNWGGSGPPTNNDLLIFGAGSEATLNNDIAADTVFQIRLDGADGYDLTGNTIDLVTTGSVVRQTAGSGTNTISFDITDTTGDTRFTTDEGTLVMAGVLTSGSNLVTSGAGTLRLTNAANNYAGTYILNGTVAFDAGALGTGDIRLGWSSGTGTLEYIGSTAETVSNTVQIGGNSGHTGGGIISNTGTGALTFDAANFNTVDSAGVTRDIEFSGTGAIEVSGVIRDNDQPITLTKSGSNTLTLSGANTYTGGTTVSGGELVISGSNTDVNSYRSATTVATGATLSLSSTGNINNQQAGMSIVLEDGSTLQKTSLSTFVVLGAAGGGVTVDTGASVTINDTGNAGANDGFFLDGGLKGSGTVTINASNASTGVNFRQNNSTFAGTLIVNGIASDAVGAGSGIGVHGETTGLQNADIQLNGTMELKEDDSGLSWANAGSLASTFQMGALSGSGVMVGNHKTAGGTASVTLGNTNNDGTFSGVIADGVNNVTSITKVGTGTQTFSGDNTYTGSTTVSAGTLRVQSETALGSTAGDTTVADGATLELNYVPPTNADPIAENITLNGAGVGGTEGALKVTATGPGAELNGTVTLGSNATINNTVRVDHQGTITDGASSFTLTKIGAGQWRGQFDADFAHLVIAEGEYEVASNLALASDTVTVNSGARLDTWGERNLTQAGHTPTITFNDNSSFHAQRNNDFATIDGAIVLNGNVGFYRDNIAGGLTVLSDISGTGALTLEAGNNDAGTMTFSGNNTYSATTIIGDGTTGAGSMILNAGSATGLSNNSDFQVSDNSFLVLGGNSNTIGSLGDFSGAGGIVQNANASAATLTVGDNDNNTTFSGIIRDGGAGALSLTKIGTGTQTLSGANTYTGDTTVSGGTLSLASTYTHTGTGDFIVNGGTLKVADGVDISSSAMMTISLGGVISPGNSPGTAITGAQTWSDGGTYLWEINASDDAGGTIGTDPGWDWLSITGTLELGGLSAGGFTIDIDSLTAGNIAGDAVGFGSYIQLDGIADYSFTIATATSINGFDAANFTLDYSGFSNAPGWDWGIIQSGNSLVLQAYALPEPSSTALLGLGGLALMLRRKRS